MTSSWLEVPADSPFSIANIPFGIISTEDNPTPRAAVAIGAYVVDLEALSGHDDFFDVFPSLKSHRDVFSQSTLNAFAALGRDVHGAVRTTLQDILSADTERPEFLKDNEKLRARALLDTDKAKVQMHLPMRIGDYTDFYAGFHHAYKVGALLRGPQNALQPNYTHLPVGYHGRSSSIVTSGTPIQRPVGQILPGPNMELKNPIVAPCRRLDIELELGCFIGTPSKMGDSIDVDDAEQHIFGYVLMNDWSARDIQNWEYVPLGPFNGKNFATTISPWVVLADALEPFRCEAIANFTRLHDYLEEKRFDRVFDIGLEVELTTPQGDTTTICSTSSKYLTWSFPQMIAHHTLGGCPLNPGDLLGSGTISGTGNGEKGCLLEMTDGGKKDIILQGMEVRTFLKDGDAVVLSGSGGQPGARVGFGPCSGSILPAADRKPARH